MKKETTGNLNKIHDLSKTRLYTTWQNMKSRCYNSKNKGYINYGGRGIRICNEWKNSFLSFYSWAMENGYRSDLTIDRINVNGNYEPSNCRWATIKEQHDNRRCVKHITYNNETHTFKEWSKILNIPYETLRHRILYKKWDIEKAFKKRGT